MIDFFNNTNSQFLTALVLGLAVALNPCIITANISALTYSTEGHDKATMLKRGFLYVLGRVIAFTILGVLLHAFADKVAIEDWIKDHFGKIIGPAFIVVGLILLNLIHIHIHSEHYIESLNKKGFSNNTYAPFFIGFLVAFIFCPEGAAMYFGSMVPLLANCTDSSTYVVSFCFGIGSVFPIIPILYVMQKGSEKLAEFKGRHKNMETWIRRIIAVLFILVGVMFVFEYYLE